MQRCVCVCAHLEYLWKEIQDTSNIGCLYEGKGTSGRGMVQDRERQWCSVKKNPWWETWVAQLDKPLTLAQVMISGSWDQALCWDP